MPVVWYRDAYLGNQRAPAPAGISDTALRNGLAYLYDFGSAGGFPVLSENLPRRLSGVLGTSLYGPRRLTEFNAAGDASRFEADYIHLNHTNQDNGLEITGSPALDELAGSGNGIIFAVTFKDAVFNNQGSSLNTLICYGSITNIGLGVGSGTLWSYDGSGTAAGTSATLTAGRTYTAVIARISATETLVYLNGQLIRTITRGSWTDSSAHDFGIGYDPSASTSRNMNVKMMQAAVFNNPGRYANGFYAKALSLDPWQVWSHKRPVMLPAAVAGGFQAAFAARSNVLIQTGSCA